MGSSRRWVAGQLEVIHRSNNTWRLGAVALSGVKEVSMSSKRNIFEDVGTTKGESNVTPVAAPTTARSGIIRWLQALFLLVTLIVLVGGLTRLTDSGLSITEWAPITGALPPLSDEAWQAEFEKYQSIPEFQLQNSSMVLDEFKTIYWWEWGHRQLGRIVGLVWAAGFFWFLFRKQIPRGWTLRLLSLGILGGLQGAIGWWMVSSGLSGRMVDVASYRLAMHLGLAFLILGLIAWFILGLTLGDAGALQARRRRENILRSASAVLVAMCFIQVLLGALVAGLDAGRGYIDWPLMGGAFFPTEALNLSPIVLNFFENEAMTQFVHRMFGYILFVAAVWAFVKARSSALSAVRWLFLWVLIFTTLQAIIGIVTVMNAAPLGLAILHQFGAIVVWVLVLRARFEVLYPKVQRLR